MQKLELRSLPSEGEMHPKGIALNELSQCCQLCDCMVECTTICSSLIDDDIANNQYMKKCMSVKNGYFVKVNCE